jgi:hypothetical protein
MAIVIAQSGAGQLNPTLAVLSLAVRRSLAGLNLHHYGY